jgi:methionyl-tRNA formyltransferase
MMEQMGRIAVAGNQWITEYLLERMIEQGFHPALLLNVRPEKSAAISGYRDLSGFAERHGIELYRPELYTLKSDGDRAALLGMEIDALLVFGWQRLIPDWLIEHCQRGVYGVHGGPKPPPRCRGRAVFNWTILLGYTNFYLYLFRITPEVDAGGIIEITEFDVTPFDDVLTLYHKNCVVSTRMMLKHLPSILKGEVEWIEQSGDEPTYLPKRTPEQGGIYWDATAERISNLIRAVAPPYPGAFTALDGSEVRITTAHVFDTKISYEAAAGTILDVFPNGDFIVMTGDYPLYVRGYECDDKSLIAAGKVFELHSGSQPPDPEV